MLDFLLSQDVWALVPILLGISFGQQRSSSQQAQESGFGAGVRGVLGNAATYGAQFLEPYLRSLFSPAQTLGPSGAGAGEFGVADPRSNILRPEGAPVGGAFSQYQLPELSARGLYAPQETAYNEAFRQAVSDVFGRTSGRYAQAGFNNPEAIGAIAGDVSKQVAPQMLAQLLPMAQQNILARLQVPHALTMQDFATYIDYLRTLMGVPGGTGQGTASASGFNMGLGGGGQGVSSLGITPAGK